MDLSLKNKLRPTRWSAAVSASPEKMANGGRSAHEEGRAMLSAESHRTAKTILFIDDEPSILEMRRLVFETLGYSVLTAISGEEGLEAFRLNAVDAVVLDYLMPGMDGEETARRIREVRIDIPIILSSGCLMVPERVLEVVTAEVRKGARPEVLIQVLEQQLHSLCDRAPTPSKADSRHVR
jgi:CheY-like chemotaxis protein